MSRFLVAVQYPVFWTLIVLFIAFYPLLISIYVFLPLLIGIMGYVLIEGIEKRKLAYILIASFYYINLEVNLSLPLFLTFISALLIYVLFYPYLKHFRRCPTCVRILIVLLMDIFYLGVLLFYDFLLEDTSVILDSILLYSLIVDLLIVVIV
ncbi:MAG: hypothetical protein PHR75_05765 [Sulfurovum sp.]|nr:hypothetical protein [Sulfurovum sp.]MDD3602416.1 hypothetical protein [Sulfurovum sp.]